MATTLSVERENTQCCRNTVSGTSGTPVPFLLIFVKCAILAKYETLGLQNTKKLETHDGGGVDLVFGKNDYDREFEASSRAEGKKVLA